MENRAFGALATALLLCCACSAAAAAEPLRVLYAEPFQPQSASTSGVQKPGPDSLSVRAFGRAFELELEDNSRLLRGTSTQTRARIGAIKLLKGTVKDAPGSWVRLTLSAGRYSGAFWDGSELYAIAPRETLDGALLAPMAAAATAIYRLSDTQGGLFTGTCAVAGSADVSARPTAKFRSLIRELRAAADTAFAAAPREIEISMVGDFEFTSRHGAAAVGTMVDRMNVVDGIFSNQVGVATVPADFITFTSNIDPFTSSEPSALLNQFADYRNATPVVRSRGLAHLLTGRQLNGNVIGIAFLGSLCRAREGSGLTESSDFIDSALVIAHELGHNFGAPHDGEAGSSCASTPQSFIMAPELNGSSTFSACSLQEMQPRIQAAACVIAARNRDLQVSTASTDIEAIAGQSFEYRVDVASIGDFAALNGVLNVLLPSSLQVLSAQMPGVPCTVSAGSVRCELGEMAPAQSRRLTLSLRPQFAGDLTIDNAVTSTSDSNPANDRRSVGVHVQQERAIRLTATPQPLVVTRGDSFDMFYEVAAVGALPLNNMRLNIGGSGFTPLSASVPGGTCTLQSSPSAVSCELGSIAVGAPRQVRVRWLAAVAGFFPGAVHAFEANDPNAGPSVPFNVAVRPQRDIALSIISDPHARVAVGQDGRFVFGVDSFGVNAVDDVHVRLSYPAGITLAVADPIGASCTTVVGSTIGTTDCALGSMTAGSSRNVQFLARAGAPLNAGITAQVVLPTLDDLPANDTLMFTLDVRLGNDIVLQAGDPGPGFDERVNSLFASLSAQGANASENVRLSVTLPADFVAQSATINGQPCPIDAAERHRVSCFLPRVESNASMRLDFIAPQPGTRTALIEVTADNEVDVANNSRVITIETRPNVDARLTAPPSPQRARTDLPVEIVFTVQTGKYSVPDALLNFVWFSPLDDFSASAPGASCASNASGHGCEWTTLPANTSIPVTVRLRSSARTSLSISAFLNAAADVDIENNRAFLAFPIVVPGDAGVLLAQPTATLTNGQFTTVSGINIVTLSPLEQPFVDVTFDQTRLLFAGIEDGFCVGTSLPQTVRCVPLSMEQLGTRSLKPRFMPQGAGAASVAIRVGAFNDFNTGNDEQTITLTIVDPTPPSSSPPPPPPPAGGRGGGGSVSWVLAVLLLAMWHHRRARLPVRR